MCFISCSNQVEEDEIPTSTVTNMEKIIGVWKLDSVSFAGTETMELSAVKFVDSISGKFVGGNFIIEFENELDSRGEGFYVLRRNRINEINHGGSNQYTYNDTIDVIKSEEYAINAEYYAQTNGMLISELTHSFFNVQEYCRFDILKLTEKDFEISFSGSYGELDTQLLNIEYYAKFRRVE